MSHDFAVASPASGCRCRTSSATSATAVGWPRTEPADTPGPLGSAPARPSPLAIGTRAASATDAIVQAISELAGAAHTKRRLCDRASRSAGSARSDSADHGGRTLGIGRRDRPSGGSGQQEREARGLGSTTPSSREQACRCPTSAWPKLSDTRGVQPGRRCRHRDRLDPSALECSPRRMPLRALQQSVFRLAQCSIMKRGLAAYRLSRTCALPARCTGVGEGSGDSRAVAEGGQRGARFFPGSGAACAPGRWRDQFSPLRGKVLVLMRSGSGPPRRPVSRESIALISVVVSSA
jgi:hypothetical protein